MGRRLRTQEEDEWLLREVPLHTTRETTELFAEEFGWEIPIRTVENFRRVNDLTFVRVDRAHLNTHARTTIWTPERDEFFREFVPGHTARETRAAFLERFGIELTEGQIGNRKHTLGVRSGTNAGCFKKGNVSHNKGKHWYEFMSEEAYERSSRSHFSNGNIPHNTRDLLDERVTKDGYLQVHVGLLRNKKLNDQWVMKSRFVYEREYGEIPDDWLVVFCDHDKRNFDPDNLAAVSKGDHAVMTATGAEYHDKQTFEACLARARLTRAINDAQTRPRTCAACGMEFTPSYPNQRRCRACIDAHIPARRRSKRK
jgi:hypothetical protein